MRSWELVRRKNGGLMDRKEFLKECLGDGCFTLDSAQIVS